MASDAPIILLADIHANEEALRAVMEHARSTYESGRGLRIWFLGDLFGRGPEPERTWTRLLRLAPEAIVVGNHDWMLTGRLSSIPAVRDVLYSEDDQRVLFTHREELAMLGMLTLDAERWPCGGVVHTTIEAWPAIAQPIPGVYLVHGGALLTPNQAASSEALLVDMIVNGYVARSDQAASTLEAVALLARRERDAGGGGEPPGLVLIGHYHRRTLYRTAFEQPWQERIQLDRPYELAISSETPALVSPGSVGFPREDYASEPSYAVLILEDGLPSTVTFHAVPYQREPVRTAMQQRGYPSGIIERL